MGAAGACGGWQVLALLLAAGVRAEPSQGLTNYSTLETTLQAIVDFNAQQFNASGSFAVVFNDGTKLVVAAGVDDHSTPGSVVQTTSKYPAGSLTKPTVATAVLQLHEQGKIDIDQPVPPAPLPCCCQPGPNAHTHTHAHTRTHTHTYTHAHRLNNPCAHHSPGLPAVTSIRGARRRGSSPCSSSGTVTARLIR